MNDNNFEKQEIYEYKFENPCKKYIKSTIGKLRKQGDLYNQYVTNVYYLDTLYFSSDDNCSPCSKQVKENPIVGYLIHPAGVKPAMNFRAKKEYWQQLRQNQTS